MPISISKATMMLQHQRQWLSRCPRQCIFSQAFETSILQCRRHCPRLGLDALPSATIVPARSIATTSAHHFHPRHRLNSHRALLHKISLENNQQHCKQDTIHTRILSLNFATNSSHNPHKSAPLSSFGRGKKRDSTWINEHGHYYTQVGGPIDTSICTLSEDEIHNLIRERMERRHERDYETADEIINQLRQCGVDIDDKAKEWRADGTRMISSQPPTLNEFGHFYTQIGDPVDTSICNLSEDQIHDMIRERMFCKAERDFKKADSIRSQLNGWGISLDDKLYQWQWKAEWRKLGQDPEGNR